MFDHIRADFASVGIDEIVKKISLATAEIDGVEHVTLDLSLYAPAKVTSVDQENVTLFCNEWQCAVEIPLRNDALEDRIFFIKKTATGYAWTTCVDWLCDKDGLLPAFSMSAQALAGGWKKEVETDDYILEIDNKSITNRPDLWGHRGFARELAALLGKPLRPEKDFLVPLSILSFEDSYKATPEFPFALKKSDSKICNRLAALYVESVSHQACSVWMASRLLRVQARSIDCLVDATNYVMFDMGYPMHAFDANAFAMPCLEARMAKAGEQLTLLDGSTVTLTPDDLVIADGTTPLALAGVMGGRQTGVSSKTTAMVIEAGHFDATAIRLTAARFKQRTDASARFEKTLDPNQNVVALQRYIKILKDEKVSLKFSNTIVSLGKELQPRVIEFSHEFIQQRLGITLSPAFVKKSLSSIGMSVVRVGKGYTVTVPTFRSSKDVTIPEDIVEELLRLYGFDNIPLSLARINAAPTISTAVPKVRLIKNHLAFHAQMKEVENYMLYDNDFLKLIKYKIASGVRLANPLSEQRDTLVTSLIPHLLQNVHINMANHDALRFFEWARDWSLSGDKVVETRRCAGIFFDKKDIDFYEIKEQLATLFTALSMPVEWRKSTAVPVGGHKHQTADLYCGSERIGFVARVSQKVFSLVGAGDAWIFELNGDLLLEYSPVEQRFVSLPKFQASWLDISMMVPLSVAVGTLKAAIKKSDVRIFEVQLVDVFKKDEWKDSKSITMRFGMRDASKTLSKEDIDAGIQAVHKAVQQEGAQIR